MRRFVLVLPLAACSGGGETDTDLGPTPVCETASDVACVDDLILDLSLHDDKVATDADVTTTTDGEDFVTSVDATAGGMNAANDNPWVYVKFTETGAQRVDIDDETALESMDWDVAARRFVIRLNGGASGPSCVGAAAFLESSYVDLTAIPDGITFVEDAYYTSECTFVPDSFGLGSAQVVLTPWWEYEGCVKTTGVPFLVQLADGHVVKFSVESYYGTGQDDCNTSDTPGQDGGQFTWRWRYMN